MAASYQDFYQRSINQRDAFWAEQARLVDWHEPFERVLDYSRPPFARWFVGGQTNLCHNAVDRHLSTRPDQPALVWISTEVDQQKTYTYRELHAEVNQLAAALRALGVGKGDRVLIYMPMIPEAVFAMLATVRIGAIHSVVFGGFAAASLAARIDDAQPKVMITSDAGMRMGKVIALKPLADEAIRLSNSPPQHVVVVNRGLAAPLSDDAGARSRLCDTASQAPVGSSSSGVAGVVGTELRAVHERHHRPSQRRPARHRRLRGGAGCFNAAHLLLAAGRGLLLHLGHRLGGGPFLHRVRAAHQRIDLHHVRGRADAARRRGLVEDRARLSGDIDVFFTYCGASAEEARPGLSQEVRHLEPQVPVPCRRTAGPAHVRVDRAGAGGQGHRPLLADRIRLADLDQRPRSGRDATQARLTQLRCVRLPTRAQARGNRRRGGAEREGRAVHRAASAAGVHEHRVGERRTLRANLLFHVPTRTDLYHLRLGAAGRGRLLLYTWAAPTTSSTSPATGSGRGRSRRRCRRTPTSPRWPWWESTMR